MRDVTVNINHNGQVSLRNSVNFSGENNATKLIFNIDEELKDKYVFLEAEYRNTNGILTKLSYLIVPDNGAYYFWIPSVHTNAKTVKYHVVFKTSGGSIILKSYDFKIVFKTTFDGDPGSIPESQDILTELIEMVNDAVIDPDYVHTDNNFTDAEKEKLLKSFFINKQTGSLNANFYSGQLNINYGDIYFVGGHAITDLDTGKVYPPSSMLTLDRRDDTLMILGLSPAELALIGLVPSKADLVNGKIIASQLPSYVDDVVNLASLSETEPGTYLSHLYYNTITKKIYEYVEDSGWVNPQNPESGIIYVDCETNKTYRWNSR